jgi:hypothetical protein
MKFMSQLAASSRTVGRDHATPQRYFRPVQVLGLILIYLCALMPGAHATSAEHGPSPEIMGEATAAKIEIARLRVHNIAGGAIEGSRDGGQTWWFLGRVVQPTMKVNRRGFNASKYVPVGSVAATAVNAIHLKAAQNVPENRGVIWSLAPRADTAAGRVSLQSEVSPGSAVFTDIPGGSGIFGGPFTPFVGNPIFLDNDKNNDLKPLPDNYVPALGNVWVIVIERPRHYPRQIVFENRFGGLITIEYRGPGEKPRPIGQVLRPVLGVGRFIGSYFSEVGRLRANHAGVIDISTSPRGKVGSFQIVPANHAMSPETNYIRELTQWMVVGPVSALDPSWEGSAPLYSSFLRPRYDRLDWYNDDPLERFIFQVKVREKNGQISDWKPMPTFSLEADAPLPKWAGTALSNVTHIGIFFPLTTNAYEAPASTPTTAGGAPAAAGSVPSLPGLPTVVPPLVDNPNAGEIPNE